MEDLLQERGGTGADRERNGVFSVCDDDTGSLTLRMKRFQAYNGERTNKHNGKNRKPRVSLCFLSLGLHPKAIFLRLRHNSLSKAGPLLSISAHVTPVDSYTWLSHWHFKLKETGTKFFICP